MKVEPYLFFGGHCEEAIEFYKAALGAEVDSLHRFRDAPPSAPPAQVGEAERGDQPPGDKIMHANLRIGQTQVMLSDGCCGGKPDFQGFSLTIEAGDDEEAQRLFNALADGGQVRQPLTKTFFASSFGMVVDRLGVSWMVIAGA